ncbi:MAG: 50S ribosomal protein L23 [Candidatus Saccharimonadaceae bacterium]
MILVTPRATEKAYGLIATKNTYIFNVPLDANKDQITKTVEKQFGVKVVSIKTLVQSGKSVRFSLGKRRNPGITNRSDSKKAYVTLAEGDSIKVFDEEVTAPEEKAPSTAKAKKEKK